MSPPFKSSPVEFKQSLLFPANIFDLLDDDHECYLYAELFEQLDTSELESQFSVLGQHAYHPKLIISILIYAYSQGVFKMVCSYQILIADFSEQGVNGSYTRDSVLRRLSENRIEREVRLQEVVDALKGKGDLHNQISLWNLKPSYTAMLFNTSCDNWYPERFNEHLPKFEEHWHSIADEENILVLLAIQTTPVKWGTYKDLIDTNYKLLVAHWDKDRKALFVFSNDYKVFRVEKMAEALCGGDCELVAILADL